MKEAKAKFELQKEIEMLKNGIFEFKSTLQAKASEMKEAKENECSDAARMKEAVANMEGKVAQAKLDGVTKKEAD